MENFDIKVLYSKEEIQSRISELSKEIDKDYEGKELVVISILKGALYFTIDLTREMKTPIVLDTIHARSYIGTETSGNISILDDLSVDITDKDVLIVEDIIDTGLTLNKIKGHILAKHPKSLKIAVLVNRLGRRVKELSVDYCGFETEDKFVIGYGFDYNEKYRNLPYIGYIEQ